MLPAREFYHLQKMQKQGKLANNSRASAMVDRIAETLNTKCLSAEKSEQVLHPVFTPVQNASTESNLKKRKRKRCKKPKNTSDFKQNGQTGESVTDTCEGHTEKPIEPCAAQHLSRSQRKNIRKKRKKQNKKSVTAQTDVEHAKNDLTTPPQMVGHKRQPPPTDDGALVCPPHKKPCSSDSLTDTPKTTSGLSASDDVPNLINVHKDLDFWHLENPVDIGRKLLESILYPISLKDFFTKYFEKQPLYLRRSSPIFDDWLSVKDLDVLLRKERVMFTEHLDLASYENGRRVTPNPPGRAFRSVVWDYYNTGCSIRLLCPQMFFKHIRYRLSLLQEYFGCFVGANVYLTPPNSQGFAPHYDDIEAFILQIEGTKCWRVYAPRDPSETLPITPSPNLTDCDLNKPILTTTLNPGDLLYLPRGYIHQASTEDTAHSLHITISTHQKHTWGEFIKKLLPVALQTAVETDIQFREGLPIGFLRHVGGFASLSPTDNHPKNVAATKCLTDFRAGIVRRLRSMVDQLEQYGSGSNGDHAIKSPDAPDPLLTAADLFAVDLIGQSLPPQLREDELTCHAQKQGERWSSHKSSTDIPAGVTNVVELQPDTKVRLVRWSAVRAVRTRLSTECTDTDDSEGGVDEGAEASAKCLAAVYHSLSNTNVYQEHKPEEMALSLELLPALDHLARKFPKFVKIETLPLPGLEDRLRVAVGLYDAGLLVTENPLPPVDDEDDDDDDDMSTFEEFSTADEDDLASSDDQSEEQSRTDSLLHDAFDSSNLTDSSETERFSSFDDDIAIGVGSRTVSEPSPAVKSRDKKLPKPALCSGQKTAVTERQQLTSNRLPVRNIVFRKERKLKKHN